MEKINKLKEAFENFIQSFESENVKFTMNHTNSLHNGVETHTFTVSYKVPTDND